MKIDRDIVIKFALESGFEMAFENEVGIIGDYNIGYELTDQLEKFANIILTYQLNQLLTCGNKSAT
jgi:hypothetical protein